MKASKEPSITSQFFSGTLMVGAARGGSIVLGLISMVISVRHVSTDEYGAYVLLILITGFLAEFMGFGMTLSIPKYLAASQDEAYKKTLNNTVFMFRCLTILGVSLLIYAVRPILVHVFGASLLLDLLNYLPVLFGFSTLSLLFSSILRGQFRFAAFSMIEFVTGVVELGVICLGIFVFRLGLFALLLAKFASGGLYIVLGYLQVHFSGRPTIDMPILKELLRFGFPLQLQYLLDFSYSRIDTMIIGSLLGTAGIAYYEIARRIPDTLMQLYTVFVTVYFPIVANLYANDRKEKNEYVMNNSLRVLSFLAIYVTLGTILFGKDIIRLLFSDAYLPSYLAFVILMIAFTLKVLENTLGYTLVAIGDSDKPLIINIVRTLFSAIGNFVFLPIAGFVGAALVNVISNLLVIPLDAMFLWKRKIHTRFSEYLKPVAIMLLLSIPFAYFGIGSGLLPLVILILYFVSCLLLSVIQPRDIILLYKEAQQVVNRLRKRRESPAQPG